MDLDISLFDLFIDLDIFILFIYRFICLILLLLRPKSLILTLEFVVTSKTYKHHSIIDHLGTL